MLALLWPHTPKSPVPRAQWLSPVVSTANRDSPPGHQKHHPRPELVIMEPGVLVFSGGWWGPLKSPGLGPSSAPGMRRGGGSDPRVEHGLRGRHRLPSFGTTCPRRRLHPGGPGGVCRKRGRGAEPTPCEWPQLATPHSGTRRPVSHPHGWSGAAPSLPGAAVTRVPPPVWEAAPILWVLAFLRGEDGDSWATVRGQDPWELIANSGRGCLPAASPAPVPLWILPECPVSGDVFTDLRSPATP